MNQSDPLPFRILKRKRTQQFKLKRDRYTKDYHRSMRYGWANDYLLTSVIGLNDLVVPFQPQASCGLKRVQPQNYPFLKRIGPPNNRRRLSSSLLCHTFLNQSCSLCSSHAIEFLYICLQSFSLLESDMQMISYLDHTISANTAMKGHLLHTLLCDLVFLSFFNILDVGLPLICGYF